MATLDKRLLSERDIRTELIGPALHHAGWNAYVRPADEVPARGRRGRHPLAAAGIEPGAGGGLGLTLHAENALLAGKALKQGCLL